MMTITACRQYIHTTMQKHWRTVTYRLLGILMLTVIFALPLHAGIPVRNGLGVSADIGWYGSIPSEFHEDPLPIRSHLSFGGTLTPSVFGFGTAHELSAGISGYYTTRSLIYGVTVWRPFLAIGPTIDYTYHFNNRFSITPSLSVFAGLFTQTLDIQAMLRISVAGGYELQRNPKHHRWIITLPLSIDLRSDYVSVTAGVGMKWRYDRSAKEEQP